MEILNKIAYVGAAVQILSRLYIVGKRFIGARPTDHSFLECTAARMIRAARRYCPETRDSRQWVGSTNTVKSLYNGLLWTD